MSRILLVEDYEDMRLMVADYLRKEGYQVEDVGDGVAAQALLANFAYDLLILDWQLPGASGIDICREFRALGGAAPILMLTGKKGIRDKEEGFAAGADDYLTKPFHARELLARVKALLRRAPAAAPPAKPAGEMRPGSRLADRWEIISVIGRGNMGMIYKANHSFLNKLAAIKVLHPYLVDNAESSARFKLEARTVSSLEHPNIIRVHDFGITPEGLPYIVMDYLEGTTLFDVLQTQGRITPERTISLFAQLSGALAHAHERGVIHRDLKPSNMMLVTRDNEEVLKIVDFGIAKLMDSPAALELTQEGNVMGSPLYMSPEQVLGKKLDPRSDIFAAGCVMYQALSGVCPFLGDNIMETMLKRTAERARPFAQLPGHLDIPAPLEAVVSRAMARDPARRYQNMLEFGRDLHLLARGM